MPAADVRNGPVLNGAGSRPWSHDTSAPSIFLSGSQVRPAAARTPSTVRRRTARARRNDELFTVHRYLHDERARRFARDSKHEKPDGGVCRLPFLHAFASTHAHAHARRCCQYE